MVSAGTLAWCDRPTGRDGRRSPLVPPRRVATSLHEVLHSVSALRVRPAAQAGLPVRFSSPTPSAGRAAVMKRSKDHDI